MLLLNCFDKIKNCSAYDEGRLLKSKTLKNKDYYEIKCWLTFPVQQINWVVGLFPIRLMENCFMYFNLGVSKVKFLFVLEFN